MSKSREITILARFDVAGSDNIGDSLVQAIEDGLQRASDEGCLTPNSCEDTSVETFGVRLVGDIKANEEDENEARSARAQTALAAFDDDYIDPLETTTMRDLLADLMHLAKKNSVNFEEELRIAKEHFQTESA